MTIPLGELQRLLTGTFGNTLFADSISDALSAPSRGLDVNAFLLAFDNTTWYRWRNTLNFTLLASATRTASTVTSGVQTYNAKFLILKLDITARTVGASPLINIRINYYDSGSGNYDLFLQTPDFDPTIGEHFVVVGPGVGAVVTGSYRNAQGIFPVPLPALFSVIVFLVSDVTDLTYSLAGVLGV